jgi:hypothetical protein
VGALGVQGICGDDLAGQVDPLQQRPELGDLAGLAVDPPLRDDRAAGVGQRGEQVHPPAGTVPGAAQGRALAWGFVRPRQDSNLQPTD